MLLGHVADVSLRAGVLRVREPADRALGGRVGDDVVADGRGQGIVVARKAQNRALRLEGQSQLAACGDDEFRSGCQLLQRVGREFANKSIVANNLSYV